MSVHAYLQANVTPALNTDELLRSEYVARISALDLYIHELVLEKMLDIFNASRPPTAAYNKHLVSNALILQLLTASNPFLRSSYFELDVRDRHSIKTFQDPDKVADAIRLISPIELWKSVAGVWYPDDNVDDKAKDIKKELSLIVDRRNKIAHEGDVEPTLPRGPRTIGVIDIANVRRFIKKLVDTIDTLI
jgi:hypothetical protein